jgi:hypothetical protein
VSSIKKDDINKCFRDTAAHLPTNCTYVVAPRSPHMIVLRYEMAGRNLAGFLLRPKGYILPRIVSPTHTFYQSARVCCGSYDGQDGLPGGQRRPRQVGRGNSCGINSAPEHTPDRGCTRALQVGAALVAARILAMRGMQVEVCVTEKAALQYVQALCEVCH